MRGRDVEEVSRIRNWLEIATNVDPVKLHDRLLSLIRMWRWSINLKACGSYVRLRLCFGIFFYRKRSGEKKSQGHISKPLPWTSCPWNTARPKSLTLEILFFL